MLQFKSSLTLPNTSSLLQSPCVMTLDHLRDGSSLDLYGRGRKCGGTGELGRQKILAN